MKMRQKDISRKFKVSPAFISRILSREKYTDRWILALALADYNKGKAINFINPRHRKVFKKAYLKEK